MRAKTLSAIVVFLIISVIIAPLKTVGAVYSERDIQNAIDEIIDTRLDKTGCKSVDEWVGEGLPAGVGIDSEWYVMTLAQSGQYDFSAYEKALLSYIGSGIEGLPASTREKLALALCAVGSTDSCIGEILEGSIDKQGLMGRVFGLHLMNNGYTCRYTASEVTDKLLSAQLEDGGWAVVGQQGDVDVTAMVIQALAPHISQKSVRDAAERGLSFISSKQQPDGGFKSMGNANPESAAQVLAALSALGIDCTNDERFIKNGNTVIDGIMKYRLTDGSFCHTEGGGSNDTATVQAMYSLVSYLRMKKGTGSFWVFDARRPPEPTAASTSATTAAISAVTESAVTETAVSSASLSSQTLTETVTEASSMTSSTETTLSEVTSSEEHTSGTSFSSASYVAATLTSAETETSSVTAVITSAADSSPQSRSYKPTAIAVIIGAAAVLSLILFAIGKRSVKNFIAVAAAAAVGILIVLATDIKSPEEYYSGEAPSKSSAIGTVTMTIRCDTVKGRAEHIPDDGIILAETSFDIAEDETVYDILTEAARTYTINIEARGTYIAGIAQLREFDFGDLSGWIYYVNGESASVGCGEYKLSDGDNIEWFYTCELGRDIEEAYGK